MKRLLLLATGLLCLGACKKESNASLKHNYSCLYTYEYKYKYHKCLEVGPIWGNRDTLLNVTSDSAKKFEAGKLWDTSYYQAQIACPSVPAGADTTYVHSQSVCNLF